MRLSYLSASIWVTAVILLSAGPTWADEPAIDQRFPIDDPSNLSPPNVVPPIHKCALAVSVSGFIENAFVTVFADGVPVGSKPDLKPGLDGSADVPLTRPLVLGETITATQTVGSIPSGHSHDAVPVTDYPTLTTPVVIPNIYQCGRVVPVGNLVASTHVDVWDTATPPPPFLGSGDATKDRLGIFTSSLATDHLVRAQQTTCPSVPGKTAKSLPLKVKPAPDPPPAPNLEPPGTGVTQVLVHGLLAGAHIQLNYGSAPPIFDGYATSPNVLVDVPPVSPAVPITAVQTLCTSSPPSPPVTAKDKLDTPVLGGPICAGSRYVFVYNTDSSANVVLLRSSKVIGYASGVAGMLKLSVATDVSGKPLFLGDGDQLSVVQYTKSSFGTFFSDTSNQVTVGCDEPGNVVTQHNNNQRTGVYSAESTLTPGRFLHAGCASNTSAPLMAP